MVVVDALVGLMILAVTLGLAFGALGSARDLAARAAETRAATSLLRFLGESSPGVAGETTGANAGFDWRLLVAPTQAGFAGAQLCSRQAVAYSRRSHHVYSLATREICRSRVSR